MREEHTISELTTNNQITDIQFLFSKYETLQQKLERTEQTLREKEQENELLTNKLDKAVDIIRASYDLVRNTKGFLAAITDKRNTKADIISGIESTLTKLDIARKELEKW